MISIEAKNEQQIKNAIKDLKKESFKNIREFMKASVVVGAGVASKNAPVDTGTLRQSIDSRVKDGGFQGEIFSGVKYAQYQNNGTSRIRGKRFMEKGVTAALNTLTKLLKK